MRWCGDALAQVRGKDRGEVMPRKKKQQNPDPVKVHVRWIIRRDMPDVMAIEAGSNYQSWTEDVFLRCLRQNNCIGMVAECGDKVLGFMIYELHKHKMHLLNFAVHPDWRRREVGTQLMLKLVSKLSAHRRPRITVEVRENNLEAQLFFRKLNFSAVRLLSGFYEDSGEDAYLMEYAVKSECGEWDEDSEYKPVNRVFGCKF